MVAIGTTMKSHAANTDKTVFSLKGNFFSFEATFPNDTTLSIDMKVTLPNMPYDSIPPRYKLKEIIGKMLKGKNGGFPFTMKEKEEKIILTSKDQNTTITISSPDSTKLNTVKMDIKAKSVDGKINLTMDKGKKGETLISLSITIKGGDDLEYIQKELKEKMKNPDEIKKASTVVDSKLLMMSLDDIARFLQ